MLDIVFCYNKQCCYKHLCINNCPFLLGTIPLKWHYKIQELIHFWGLGYILPDVCVKIPFHQLWLRMFQLVVSLPALNISWKKTILANLMTKQYLTVILFTFPMTSYHVFTLSFFLFCQQLVHDLCPFFPFFIHINEILFCKVSIEAAIKH